MAIRKRLSRKLLFTGSATALAIGASAGVALAVAITFSITPGGNVSASTSKTNFTDVVTSSVLACASSAATGTLKSGHGISGTNLGSIKTLTFSNCTGPLALTFTVTSHVPLTVHGTFFNATTGVTTGNITGIHLALSGPNCSVDIDGTADGANNGKVRVSYTNGTHKLKLLANGGNLHLYNVNGCDSLVNSGDATHFTGTYTVTPKQTITSP